MILIKCTEADREALKTIEVDPSNMDDNGAVYDGIKVQKPWGCLTFNAKLSFNPLHLPGK